MQDNGRGGGAKFGCGSDKTWGRMQCQLSTSETCRVNRIVSPLIGDKALMYNDDGRVAAATGVARDWRACIVSGYSDSARHSIAGSFRVYVADVHPGHGLIGAAHDRNHLQHTA